MSATPEPLLGSVAEESFIDVPAARLLDDEDVNALVAQAEDPDDDDDDDDDEDQGLGDQDE